MPIKALYLLQVLIFSFPILAMGETMFQISKDNDRFSCYEVDTQTRGKKYIKEVKVEKCRPANTEFVFDPLKGKCFERDIATQGKMYFAKTKRVNCKPDSVIYRKKSINDKYGCYQVDIETEGKAYFKKVSEKKCTEDKGVYFWKQTESLKGECYVQDGEKYLKVVKRLCRPDKTKFMFKKKDFKSGKCYEIHIDGPEKFIIPANIRECRPSSTAFIFYADKEGNSLCIEVDSETDGQKYSAKVPTENCKKNL